MSTSDVPGYNPVNHDELAMGCWAEAKDGSLILVESTEGSRVVYSIFDVSGPLDGRGGRTVEYRDAMLEGAFKKVFSWRSSDPDSIKWTWHDKTPFPWDRVIARGSRDGLRYASADDQLTAAERVRRSREIHRGEPVDPEEVKSRFDQLGEKAEKLIQRMQRAISKLPKGK